jgi:hypothetical protein
MCAQESGNAIRNRLRLINGYQNLIEDYVNQGWRPYIISIMFRQLPGTVPSMLRQMSREIYEFYRKLPTRFDRNPASPTGSQRIPRMILFPDFPVFKHEKKSIADVSINDGLHYGGVILTPPVSRFKEDLAEHFEGHQDIYLTDKLLRIHVKPITSNPAYVMGYEAKSYKRGRVSDGDIIILPRSLRELPSN